MLCVGTWDMLGFVTTCHWHTARLWGWIFSQSLSCVCLCRLLWKTDLYGKYYWVWLYDSVRMYHCKWLSDCLRCLGHIWGIACFYSLGVGMVIDVKFWIKRSISLNTLLSSNIQSYLLKTYFQFRQWISKIHVKLVILPKLFKKTFKLFKNTVRGWKANELKKILLYWENLPIYENRGIPGTFILK